LTDRIRSVNKHRQRIPANDRTPQSESELTDSAPDPKSLGVVQSDVAWRSLPPALLHNLRTPLNHIIGYSEMLSEQAHDEGHQGLLPDLDRIRSAGAQLLALLDDTFQKSDNAIPIMSDGPAAMNCSRPSFIGPTKQTVVTPRTSERRPVSTEPGGVLLVVDDNKMNVDVLSRRLARQGHTVLIAENGQEAMLTVRRQEFDLVLLDIMMPVMDGFEVLREMKDDEGLRNIPVIMISASQELDSIVRCIEMGADDYLFKPFDPSLLNARVSASLAKKRGRDRELRLFEQLQQNYKRLEELEKQRNDLTHMIVHDLRTPLTSVLTGMCTLDVLGDLNEDQREVMGIAVEGAQTLLGMIDDLLDVDKMESGSVQLDYAALSSADLVASAVSQINTLVKSNRLTLIQEIAPDLPPLLGDEDKLRRTLVNLLGNAIKFTPSGGTITVAASLSEDQQSVSFWVKDTGEGMPSDAFVRIFEKFGQVSSREGGRTMSTGLGLAFCKLAIEAHGGRIKVDSAPGQGSTFSFTIPISRSQ
jgi:signal transduction histidine kinase